VHRKNRFLAARRPHRNRSVKQNIFANRNRASPTISVRATKSGGRKPPWEPCTRAQRLKITQSRRWYKSQPFAAPLNANAPAIRIHTLGGPPNKHACVCANEFPTPTAGSRPPLLFPHETSVPERVRYWCCKCVCRTPTAGGRAPLLSRTLATRDHFVFRCQCAAPTNGPICRWGWGPDKSGAGRSVKSMCLDFALHVGFRTKAMRGGC
jgi:hypothetical protein